MRSVFFVSQMCKHFHTPLSTNIFMPTTSFLNTHILKLKNWCLKRLIYYIIHVHTKIQQAFLRIWTWMNVHLHSTHTVQPSGAKFLGWLVEGCKQKCNFRFIHSLKTAVLTVNNASLSREKPITKKDDDDG